MADTVEDLIIDIKEEVTDISEVNDIVNNANNNLIPEDEPEKGTRKPSKAASKPRKRSIVQVEEPTGPPEYVSLNGYNIVVNAILNTHGWVTVEKVKMPYVVRGTAQKFLPLCVIEQTHLKPYPGPYPEKELGRAPMMGFYFTTEEVRLFNRFVSQVFTQQIGLSRFSLKDMLVTLPDFLDFYTKVRSITRVIPRVITPQEPTAAPKTQGGWSQVNNTIVPYVMRKGIKMVPLSVVQFAAGLLNDVDIPSLQANGDECSYLNEACSEVGMNFEFEGQTQLLELFLVPTLSKVRVSISELPKSNPLIHARFVKKTNDRRSVFVAASAQSKELTKRKSPPPVKVVKPRKSLSDDSSKGSSEKSKGPSPKLTQEQQINRPAAPVICLKTPKKNETVKSSTPDKQHSVTSPALSPPTQSPPTQTSTAPPLIINPAMLPISSAPITIPLTAQQQLPPGIITSPGPQIIFQRPGPPQNLIQLPAPKICPQHGFRAPVPAQGVVTAPQVIMASPGGVLPQAGPSPPVLVIRLNHPIPADGKIPIILPPNMGVPGGQITLQTIQPGALGSVPAPKPPRGKVDNVVIKIESDDEDEQPKEEVDSKTDIEAMSNTDDAKSDEQGEAKIGNNDDGSDTQEETHDNVESDTSKLEEPDPDKEPSKEPSKASGQPDEAVKSDAPFNDEHLESFLEGMIKQEVCEEHFVGTESMLSDIKQEPVDDLVSTATTESRSISDVLDSSLTSDGGRSVKTEPEDDATDPSPPKRRRRSERKPKNVEEPRSSVSSRPKRSNAGKNNKYSYFNRDTKSK